MVRLSALRPFSPDEGIADVPFGLDGIIAEAGTQLLAQLADMPLDHALLDIVGVDAVDGVEDLGLGQAPALVAHQILENVALAPRQRQAGAVDLGIAPVEIHLQPLSCARPGLAGAIDPAPDRLRAGQDLAHMHGFAHHVVELGGEQLEGLLERADLAQGDDRGPGMAADGLGAGDALLELAEQKPLDGIEIGAGSGLEPVLELAGEQPERGDAFAIEAGDVRSRHHLSFIDDDVHDRSPPAYAVVVERRYAR